MPTTEKQQHESTGRLELGSRLCSASEVISDGAADEDEQHHQELALLNQIRLARLKDDLGHVEHRLVGGQRLDLIPQIQANTERAGDDQGAVEQKVPGRDRLIEDSEMRFARLPMEIRNLEVGFTGVADNAVSKSVLRVPRTTMKSGNQRRYPGECGGVERIAMGSNRSLMRGKNDVGLITLGPTSIRFST